VKAGYYSQYRVDMLQASRTVFEEAMDTPSRITEHLSARCSAFLFAATTFSKSQRVSGGEKSRLALVNCARSAKSFADGRADDAPGHGEH